MVELKREYVIPLRKKTNLAPKWRRSKKAVSVLNDFIRKHMKTDDVVICKELNEKIWENGIKNPPGKVSVIAVKIKISGKEKTIVNLLEFGIEKHLKNYNLDDVKSKNKTIEKSVVKDAEVKEVKENLETKTEIKKEVKTENKVEVEKDEAKKINSESSKKEEVKK